MADKLVRKHENWLKAYAEFVEGTEPPAAFQLWVAIATVAAAAQRKVLLDHEGRYQIHSNMYVILVGPPGSKKSTAIRTGKNMLRSVIDYGHEIHFSTQASSVAALVKQMAAIKNKEHQSLTAFSSELGSLLQAKSNEMTDFLVDIFDCEPDWDKQTIGRGLELITKPWFTLVAGTTPRWLGDNLSSTAVEGGFVARTIFVHEEKPIKRIAFPELTPEQQIIMKGLQHDIAQIAGLKGKFKFSPEGREYFRHWYEEIDPVKPRLGDERLSSYYERKQVQVQKLAMVLSLSESNSLIIEPDHIGMAVDLLEDIEPGMLRAFTAVGKNIYSTDFERIKRQISDAGSDGISYKRIIAANIHALDKVQIDNQLEALLATGIVSQTGQIFVFSKNGSS